MWREMHMYVYVFPHFGPGVVLYVLNFCLKVTSAVEEMYLHFLTITSFAAMFLTSESVKLFIVMNSSY